MQIRSFFMWNFFMSYAFAWVSIHSLRKAIMPMLKFAMSLRLLGKLNYFNLDSVVNKFCTFKCLEKLGLQNPAQCVSYMIVPKHFSFFLNGLRLKFSFAGRCFFFWVDKVQYFSGFYGYLKEMKVLFEIF